MNGLRPLLAALTAVAVALAASFVVFAGSPASVRIILGVFAGAIAGVVLADLTKGAPPQ